MCGIKICLLILVIFTFINGYGCARFSFGRIGGIRFSEPVIRLPDFKPIDFNPISIPDFKPISIPDFGPISVPKYKPIPDFDTSLNFRNKDTPFSLPSESSKFSPSLKDLKLLPHTPKGNVGLSTFIENESPGSKPKSFDTEESRAKTTRRPFHGNMATKHPLSNYYRKQNEVLPIKYQKRIKNILPHSRILNSDVGYFHTPSYYYTTRDTGTTALGFSIGENLEKWATSPQFNTDNYPRFHYVVDHYYHNQNSVPKYQIMRSDNIVNCYANSETVCLNNTMALCTYDGTLMCVAMYTSTVPCLQGNCIKSTISCKNNPAPDCENYKNITIDVPCISTINVYGDIGYKNGTIIGNYQGISTSTSKYFTKYYRNTTPVTEMKTKHTTQIRKRKLSKHFCAGIVLSPAKLPKIVLQ